MPSLTAPRSGVSWNHLIRRSCAHQAQYSQRWLRSVTAVVAGPSVAVMTTTPGATRVHGEAASQTHYLCGRRITDSEGIRHGIKHDAGRRLTWQIACMRACRAPGVRARDYRNTREQTGQSPGVHGHPLPLLLPRKLFPRRPKAGSADGVAATVRMSGNRCATRVER
jgi:hypothetical protein